MIKYNNTNNASTTLTAGISPSSTTIIVENGDILPTAPFLLTLEHFDNEKVTVREIVKCIAKVGTILTIQRGAGTCVQDDSATPKAQNNTPHSFSVGDCASIYWTSEQVQDIQNEIEKKLNIDDFQAGTYVYGATSTGTDAYSITIPGTLTSYAVGQVFRFMADTENTGNATLNVNGIGEKEILKNHDQHLQSGDIEAGQIVEVAYDGTNFQMDSQIASVISLDDISSLSYNDTTCYAGEEIHENDLIVTNGNSFNPDRTDEDLSVGGTTVNKYAIGFIGNGESTDTFSIKTSVIEGFEPDSVTINIENDDNGKPSGTALATSSSLDVFKSNTSVNNLILSESTEGEFNSIKTLYFSNLGENEGDISYSDGILTVSGDKYNYTLDITGVDGYVSGLSLRNVCPNDKYLYFFKDTSNFYQLYLPDCFSTEGAVITKITAQVDGTYNLMQYGSFDRTGHFFSLVCSRSGYSGMSFGVLYTETAFDLTSYTSLVNERCNGTNFTFMEYVGNTYVINGYSGSPNGHMFKLNNDGTVTTGETSYIYSDQPKCDIRKKDCVFYYETYSSGVKFRKRKLGLERDYDYHLAKTFTVDNSVLTTKGTKYRLTITPTVSGGIADSIKIYDKEGEYFSTCMVKDTDVSHDWSTVANKTPYIDSSCIKARYARKVNGNEVPCGFANGDYSEFEPVSYCFKGIKKGFSGLVADTLYYSNGDGGITTTYGDYIVGKSADENTLNVGQWYSQDSANDSISIRYTTSNHYESTSFIATADEYIMINTTSINRGDVTGFGIGRSGAMWYFPLSSEQKRAYLLKKGMKYQIGYTSGNVTESNPLTIECTFVKV